MACYNPEHPTIVSADSSSFGLGAVLLQDQPSGERRVVAFASRSLTATEQRYSQTEKEALAVTWAVHRFDEYVWGLRFTVETDPQPLTTLFGDMDEDLLPPRVQRLRIKLMRYQYQIFYVPGKLLPTADTLSRAPLGRAAPSTCDSLELWPQKNKVPCHLTKFWNYRRELTVCDGVLLKGGRLMIPESLRPEVLQAIHEGHQRVNHCKARARDSVWWPSIGNQIKTMVETCERCASTRVQQAEPLMTSPPTELPWQQVGVDLFHLNGQDFLLSVDYHSRYPEVMTLRSTSSQAVISAIKSVIARFGIPEILRSDNGPQFAAHDFARFAEDYVFKHVTSSPGFRQSNGEVERTVRTVKDLLVKGDDPFLSLLVYRDTPGILGFSPAQLLMGRQLRTQVPKAAEKLQPAWPKSQVFLERDSAVKRRQASDFNRRHGVRELRELSPGEDVWVTDAQCPAQVLSRAQRPRSYFVETPRRVLQRNRRHLVPFGSQPTEPVPVLPVPAADGANGLQPQDPEKEDWLQLPLHSILPRKLLQSQGQIRELTQVRHQPMWGSTLLDAGARVVAPKRLNL